MLEQELLEREEGGEGEEDAGDEMSEDEENDAPTGLQPADYTFCILSAAYFDLIYVLCLGK